jgi:hypothetical protein
VSLQTLLIYKNEINNIGNTLLQHHNDKKVRAKAERLKVLADKLNKAIAALSKEVETQATAANKRVMPCPAFAKGEHCTVLRVAMCPDEPCELSRART